MLKYLLFIILGILIFVLLNRQNGFSVGVPITSYYSTQYERFYYYNTETEESTWTAPPGWDWRRIPLGGPGENVPLQPEGLPPGPRPASTDIPWHKDIPEPQPVAEGDVDVSCATDLSRSLIDASVPEIVLSTIVEDLDDSDKHEYFKDDDIAAHNRYKKANISKLPCKLKVSGGPSLKFVSIVDKGSYGVVYKYSTHNKTNQEDYVSVAVKTYTYDQENASDSGQNDPEIAIIESMNSDNPDASNERRLKDCHIVDARIISVGTSVGKSDENVCIMNFMDGDIKYMVDADRFTDETKQNLVITIAFAFKCISEARYVYTDLKPANILYKRSNDQYTFLIGDIGSIIKEFPQGPKKYNTSTYPIPEREFKLGEYRYVEYKGGGQVLVDYYNNVKDSMIWGIGALIALLYSSSAYMALEWGKLRGSYARGESIENYYDTILSPLIRELNGLIERRDNQIREQLLDIAINTLTRPADRYSLDRIYDELTT